VIAVVTAVAPLPAAAQFSGGRSAFAERPQPELVQFRDFFRFPFGDDRPRDRGFGNFSPYNPYTPPRPPQAVEATKPPAPRKVETQPTSAVLVIGDTFADWLAFGLEQTLADTPEIGVVRKIRPSSGLVRYDVRPDSPDWSQAVKDMLATEKANAIVIMLGVNDRLPLRERAPSSKTSPQGQQTEKAASANSPSSGAAPAPNAPPADSEQPAAAAPEPQRRPPGGSYEFRTDTWAELYEKRIDEMIAAAKSKGVPVFWVGLPAIRGAKSTSDMNYLDALYRARAEKAGIAYIDIWDGFVDEKGQFTMQGPDFEGQIRRLRTYDGVNFTNVGAEKLAHYVEHELRPALAAPVVPVALPGPEEQAPAKGNAKPVVGPVVPLNAAAAAAAASGAQKGELLGATDHPAQHDSDSVATQVLNHGDAIAAPPGRADNFSWPRADAGGAVDVASPPPPAKDGAPKEAAPKDASKDAASKNDAKKSTESKSPAGAASAKPRGTHQAPDSAQ
jgi:uncharacterized protein